jgi:ubiquinone/menaquinone biosynthesis C-methylase UbiE
MKQTTLELICCPLCKSTLSLNAKNGNGIIANGDLLCSACDRSYPIKKGIVRFIDPQELTGPNQHFERYYNRLAPFYSIFTKFAFLPFGGERKAREEILKHLGKGGGRTLEVSIGNGVNLPYLYEASNLGEIYGIDISIGQLSQCQRLLYKRDWQVELFLAKAESLPFKNEMFDNVLHIGGINFFTDKKRALEEMIRVARSGGTVVIADEAERLAKRFNRSFTSDHGDEALETMLYNLVPRSMQDIRLEGIWKMHGQPHGYCLEFTKPE